MDYYTFTGYAGDRIVADIDAAVNGSTLDSILYLIDSDGTTVLDYNDDSGDSLDSHIEYTLPHDGDFYLKVEDYWSEGAPDHFYSLSLFPFLTVDQASITDVDWNPETIFYPNEVIGLWTTTSNHATQVISTTWWWDTYGPAWQWIPSLSYDNWTYNLQPGTETWGIMPTIPQNLPGGNYFFIGSVSSENEFDYKWDVFTLIAPPDLAPYQRWDWEYPLVPSSVQGTHEVDTLYAGQTTYIDWGVQNLSGLDISGNFYVDLYFDDTRFVHYPFSGISAGNAYYFLDWAETFTQGGWHRLKIIVDPENNIAEADETNNVWEYWFYWDYNCTDSWEPNDDSGMATNISYGDTLWAEICPPGDVDYYTFNGEQGDIIWAYVDAQTYDSELDPYLYLLDSDGLTILGENDDYYGLDAHIHHTLPHDGTFYLKVREYNDPYEGGADYFYATSLYGLSATTAPFLDDMESGASDWTATGLWHLVDEYTSPYPESHSWSHSWWYGQDATGDYDTGAANSGDLTSPPIYIPDTGYYLRFWYWYETETQATEYDTRLVQISTDGGPFETVLQLYDDPMRWWLQSPAIDLSAYAGHTIRVRFHFDTLDDVFNDYRGWYIDDFEISTTPPPACSDGHEPNDTPAQATSIAYGQTLSADICPGGDYDFYTFTGAAGDKVVVDIDAEVNGSLLDSY
ncbi:MAG: hypothetical protein DRI52_06650, partial [Chloroflexi bacterium]